MVLGGSSRTSRDVHQIGDAAPRSQDRSTPWCWNANGVVPLCYGESSSPEELSGGDCRIPSTHPIGKDEEDDKRLHRCQESQSVECVLRPVRCESRTNVDVAVLRRRRGGNGQGILLELQNLQLNQRKRERDQCGGVIFGRGRHRRGRRFRRRIEYVFF